MYLEGKFVQILNPSSPTNLSTFSGEGNGNLLQNSCLENSTEEPPRVYGVKKSWARLGY